MRTRLDMSLERISISQTIRDHTYCLFYILLESQYLVDHCNSIQLDRSHKRWIETDSDTGPEDKRWPVLTPVHNLFQRDIQWVW